MSDLISRQEAIDAVCGRCGFYSDDTCGDPKDGKGWQCEDVRAINALPSADRPKGKWILEDFVGSICDNCGEHPYPYQADSSEDCYWTPDFCPNCGADMRGEKKGAKCVDKDIG